jgi:hypothetical protein
MVETTNLSANKVSFERRSNIAQLKTVTITTSNSVVAYQIQVQQQKNQDSGCCMEQLWMNGVELDYPLALVVKGKMLVLWGIP